MRYIVLGAIVAALALASCTANSTYMGIPLRSGGADPDLGALARSAQSGNKRAKLNLGIRFEEARGVARNFQYAMKLYRAAATSSGGERFVYIPAANHHAPITMRISDGLFEAGLPEARERLITLERRLVTK